MKKASKILTRLGVTLLAALILSSCGFRPADKYDSMTAESTEEAVSTETEATPAAQIEDDTDGAPETLAINASHPVGVYYDKNNNGNYTRLTEWSTYWSAKDVIAIFDIIPSEEETLAGYPYKTLWLEEAEKTWGDAVPRNRFELYYKLKDGTEVTLSVSNPSEAETAGESGYVEVYLYDDIHQDGSGYSYLTETDVTESTVVSSVKLTAGGKISEVETLILRVYPGASSDAVEVEIKRIGG